MISTGIVRQVDELGRIVLPKELRTSLHIGNKDSLSIFQDGQRIILQKYEPACFFCGSMDELVHYKEHNICACCIKKLSLISEG